MTCQCARAHAVVTRCEGTRAHVHVPRARQRPLGRGAWQGTRAAPSWTTHHAIRLLLHLGDAFFVQVAVAVQAAFLLGLVVRRRHVVQYLRAAYFCCCVPTQNEYQSVLSPICVAATQASLGLVPPGRWWRTSRRSSPWTCPAPSPSRNPQGHRPSPLCLRLPPQLPRPLQAKHTPRDTVATWVPKFVGVCTRRTGKPLELLPPRCDPVLLIARQTFRNSGLRRTCCPACPAPWCVCGHRPGAAFKSSCVAKKRQVVSAAIELWTLSGASGCANERLSQSCLQTHRQSCSRSILQSRPPSPRQGRRSSP